MGFVVYCSTICCLTSSNSGSCRRNCDKHSCNSKMNSNGVVIMTVVVVVVVVVVSVVNGVVVVVAVVIVL